jgi:two-component system NtrC family sensor kinase
VLLAASIFVPALLFAVAAWQNRVILFDEAGKRAVKTAETLEQNAASTMQLYRIIFLRVEDYMRSHQGMVDTKEFHEFLRQLDEDAGQQNGVFVINPDGVIVAHSRFPQPTAVIATDRDYFRAIREGGERIAIGVPVAGRLSGERRLNIAYRLQSSEGRFMGAVGISVSVTHFAEFYRTVREEPADVMSLIRSDGAILARSPELDAGRNISGNGQFGATVATANGGVIRIRSVADGIERLYAFRKIGDYPVYVSFGLDTMSVIGRWHDNVLVYATIALPAALLLLVAVWTALSWARQEEAAATLLRQESEQRSAAETRRDEAEAALRQAQKMEAIGQMTGGVAHDFNNLLTVVIGNLDIAAASGDWPANIKKHLETALKAALRGGVLTQQLLAFARRQMLRPEIVNPNRLIEDFTQLIAQAAGEAIQVQTILSPTLDPCRIDRAQFEAAILNLVVNARDAMHGVGRITIETRNLDAAAEDIIRSPEFIPGAYVLVSVTDTGDGMTPEVLEKAFEPFFTTKDIGRGSGLGLSMVYGFVKQSGGHVQIESEVGAGTTVMIYLPRSAESQRASLVGSAVDEEVPGGSEAILVVEDNEEVLKVTADMLQQLGYDIIVAGTAAEALAILRTRQPIHALFTDIVMPGGMAGDQLAGAAVRMRPGLKVLLTSGYAAQIRGRAVLDNEFPMITKPYRRAELAVKLREVLGGGARRESAHV